MTTTQPAPEAPASVSTPTTATTGEEDHGTQLQAALPPPPNGSLPHPGTGRTCTRPAADAYMVNLTATRTCRFCGVDHDITPAEPITGTLDELGDEIPAAIEAEMEELGWMDGACPHCADIRSTDLHAEYHADDFRDDW